MVLFQILGELDTANLIKKDIMVQPRMTQFSLNYLRIKKYRTLSLNTLVQI